MTTSTPTAPAASSQPIAQMILADTQAIRRDVETILSLARATALPMPGEQASFLETVTGLLQMIVTGIEQNRVSLEALHQRLNEPTIAMTLRRMVED